jgi:hypothetical protein
MVVQGESQRPVDFCNDTFVLAWISAEDVDRYDDTFLDNVLQLGFDEKDDGIG